MINWHQIDTVIQEKSLLKHKFYTAWSSGKLSQDDLRFYAQQYYALETAFPRLLSRIHSTSSDPELRQVLLGNLMDEEYGAENHRELWLRFCDALSLNREQVMNAPSHPATLRCIEKLMELAADADIVKGLSALYAYESQLPAISRSKIDGLKQFYGMDHPRAISFFTTHEEADVWHAQQEKNLLEKMEADSTVVQNAVTEACEALWGFLDGVYEETVGHRSSSCSVCTH